jgi:hypothetical protein
MDSFCISVFSINFFETSLPFISNFIWAKPKLNCDKIPELEFSFVLFYSLKVTKPQRLKVTKFYLRKKEPNYVTTAFSRYINNYRGFKRNWILTLITLSIAPAPWFRHLSKYLKED